MTTLPDSRVHCRTMCGDCKESVSIGAFYTRAFPEQAWRPGLFCRDMGVIALVLLAAAAALLVATEWPRVGSRVGLDARRRRERQRRKSKLRVVPIERDEDSDEFARSVERDLANLPTIDEKDAKR